MRLPKVDALFHSAAQYARADAVGCVMTGMGDSGAHGLFEPQAAGAVAISRDEGVVCHKPMRAVALSAAVNAAPLSISSLRILHACAQA